MSEHEEGNGKDQNALPLFDDDGAEQRRKWRERQQRRRDRHRHEQDAPSNGEDNSHCPECGVALPPQPPVVQYIFRKDGDIPPIYKQALWAVRISDLPPKPQLRPDWRLWSVWGLETIVISMAIFTAALGAGAVVLTHWIAWSLPAGQLPPAWCSFAGVKFYDPVVMTMWAASSPFTQAALLSAVAFLVSVVAGLAIWWPKLEPEV